MDFLNNTEIVVAIGFLIFIAILGYYRVPTLVFGKLDERAVKIKADLAEARALRDEAQTLLASYERRQKEVKAQAEAIVAAAKTDATNSAEAADCGVVTTRTSAFGSFAPRLIGTSPVPGGRSTRRKSRSPQ